MATQEWLVYSGNGENFPAVYYGVLSDSAYPSLCTTAYPIWYFCMTRFMKPRKKHELLGSIALANEVKANKNVTAAPL